MVNCIDGPHNYKQFKIEEIDYKHWDKWQGYWEGHGCYGLCKGTGGCRNKCQQRCDKPRKVTKSFIMCTKCGNKI